MILVALVLLVVLSVLLVGSLGIIYFREVIKHNIWDNSLAQAKALSKFTDTYLNSSVIFLESIADRPLLICSIEERNGSVTYEHLRYAADKSDFDNFYVTDVSGVILYSYPDKKLEGKNISDKPFIKGVLTHSSAFIDAIKSSDVTGKPSICISVPIISKGKVIGTLTGEIDTRIYASYLFGTQVVNSQYIHVENNTGNIIVHTNQSFMDEMKDYSALLSVQKVLKGETGVIEQYNPYQGDRRLAAYTPINSTGWGLTISMPVDMAYAPIADSTTIFAAVVLLLALLSGLIAYLLSNSLIKPLLDIKNATSSMTAGNDYRRFLPVTRKDEIGDLARSFDTMAKRIIKDKEIITAERNRAELYVDIMGHDINNLNQVALGNIQLIKDDSNLNDAQKEALNDALVSVLSSTGIIDNVRKIQRITEEKESIKPLDVNDVILQCMKEAPKPEGRKVTINYTPSPGRFIKGMTLMKEVFCNIINNSIKHTEGDVTIEINVDKSEKPGKKFYDVSIADNGPGIPDDLKLKLFNRFQRGDTKTHGKGLGLYIVRSLVEKVDGDVRIEDRVTGDFSKGAKFVVSLPEYEGGEHG